VNKKDLFDLLLISNNNPDKILSYQSNKTRQNMEQGLFNMLTKKNNTFNDGLNT